MKRKVISVLLCAFLLLPLIPTAVFAEDVALDIAGHQYVESALNSDISGTGWSWDVSENLLTLNGYDSGPIHINTTRAKNQTLRIKVNGTNTIHDQEDALELFSLDKSGTYEIFGTGTLNIGRKEEITYCLRAFDTTTGATCCIRDNVTIQISVIDRSRQRYGMTLYGKLFLQENARVSIEDDSSWGLGIDMYADLTLEGNSSLTVNNLGEAGQTGIDMNRYLLTIRDHATLSVVSEAGIGINWDRDSLTGSMRLDGTGTVSISGAKAALYNANLKKTPVVEGDKYSLYNVTGSPSGKSVKYTFPIVLINTVVLNGYETPKADETAGQNLAKIKVPSTGGYDFRDIYWCNSSGRLDPNYKFVAGQKYWIVADLDHYSGYVFEKTCGATINGSSDLVDSQSPGTIGSGASSSYRLETVRVTVPAGTPITSVSVLNVPAPAVGAPTDTDSILVSFSPSGAAAVQSIYWYNVTDNTPNDKTFKAGCQYYLAVILDPKTGSSFPFEDSANENYTGSVTFDGKKAAVAWSYQTGGTPELYIRSATVTPAAPSILWGDANGDGTVDSKDLSLLRKYMASYDYTTGTSTVAVKAGADANGDGIIDSKDLSLLRKYMASYDYTTGTSTVVLGPSK